MNQPQAQGSCLSKNPVSGPTAASSQLPNTFLSSSESNNMSIVTPPERRNPNFQEMNITMTQNFLSACGHNIPFNNIDELFRHEFLSNLRDRHCKTLMMIAAERGSLGLVQKCLDHNTPVEAKDKGGKSALYYAVEADTNANRIVALLLSKGADPNTCCYRNGVTPLLKAVEKGRFKVAELLLKAGSSNTAQYEITGDTALHVAARKGDRKIVKLLLENGWDPQKENKNRQTVWDVCKDQEITDIINTYQLNQLNKEERPPNIRRINSEALSSNRSNKRPILQEIEGERSDAASDIVQQYGEGLQISNLPEPPNLSSHANRNDDNFSNASTSCSNAHSEYRFNIKHNNGHTVNPANNTNDEATRYPDRSVQQSNPKSFHNRKREDSGVSRTSLTSVHSDMASDNESMSGHSQNNVQSDYSSIYFSPELHEKTRSTGSIGSTEPGNMHGHNGYMPNTLTKNNSFPHPYAQNNSEYNGNTYQKRKYPKNSNNHYQNGMKNPYHSQNSFESHSSQSYRREDSGYNSQGELMNHNYHYNNSFNQQKRDHHEYILQHQRSYPLPHDSQVAYQNYPPNFIPNNQNMMIQQPHMNGYVPMDMANSPNLNMPMQHPNQYFYKQQQFQYQQPQMPQDPLTKMFNKMHNGHNQLASPPTNHGIPQGNYYNQQTPPRRTISETSTQVPSEGSRQKDYIRSCVMDAKEGQKELENEKNENADLKAMIETSLLSSKSLEDELKEKDDILQSLIKRNEELEKIIREKDPNYVYKIGQSQSFSTNPLLGDFRPMTIEEAALKPYPRHKTIDEVIPVLHEEILSFERTITHYYTENNNIFDSLLALVQDSLMQIAPDAKWSIYGSFATGLCLPDSDIDIVVELPQPEFAWSILSKFESHIQGAEWVGHIKTIQNRTVPLLKITCSDAYLNKKIDITIQDLRHNGLCCVELVKDYIRIYPALRPLSLLLKHFLMLLDLNDTYSGGLSTYGLLLMIVHFFQTKEHHRSTLPMEEQNLGELLLSFLYFYGFEHDYYTHMAVFPRKVQKNGELDTIDNASNQNLLAMIQQQQASLGQPRIVIQDPISIKNNIGRSTFRIREIKNAFMAAYFEAFKPCTCEVHEYIQRIDHAGEEKEIQCTNILSKMFLAYRPEQ